MKYVPFHALKYYVIVVIMVFGAHRPWCRFPKVPLYGWCPSWSAFVKTKKSRYGARYMLQRCILNISGWSCVHS